MTEFRNMKIAINKQQPLVDVIKELERLGYREDVRNHIKINNVYCYDSGDFSILDVDCDWGEPTTLTELKNMEVFDG